MTPVPPRYPRIVERVLRDDLLRDFAAVLIVGPRGCGKSTSAAQFADAIVDLSRPGVARAAREDPDGVLSAAPGCLVIDEWQEAPEIIGAVKRAVDKGVGNDRYLLTGSVRAARQASTWPGTGRLIRLRMWGLTQGELAGDNSYNPVDTLFSDQPPSGRSELSRSDLLERVVAGRFPEALGLASRSRSRWYEGYLGQLADLDAQQVTGGRPEPQKLRAVLASCAARTGQVLNKQATARDAGVTAMTADAHLSLLEDLSVVVRIPAWHDKRLYRLTRSPKVHVADHGMAAHLLGLNAVDLSLDATAVGQLFETFVASELLPHLDAGTEVTFMHHFRDHSGREVDVLLERRGRFVGIEVKSGTSAGRDDARHLRWLRDRLGDSFHLGVVLYSGQLPIHLGDRLWALPLSTLWQAPR